MTFRYHYGGTLSESQVAAALTRFYYSVEGVAGCTVDAGAGDIVVDAQDAAANRVRAVLEDVVADTARQPAPPAESTMWERPGPAASTAASSAGAAQVGENGVLRGLAAILPPTLDRLFLDLALTFGAAPRQYPAMIPMRVMEACHYLEHFPQDIYGVHEFPHDAEALGRLVQTADYGAAWRTTGQMLAPAVCYHCYHELRGERLEGDMVLTASGSCFRHEAPWRICAHRLSEFRMREIVFLGSAEFVRETRARLMAAAWRIFGDLGLAGEVRTASDPFYFAQHADLAHRQLAEQTKYELIGSPPGAEPFSLASFNDLGDSLCAPFAVADRQGSPLHSGCVGFGLERWTLALVRTHGPALDRWPASVREALGLQPPDGAGGARRWPAL